MLVLRHDGETVASGKAVCVDGLTTRVHHQRRVSREQRLRRQTGWRQVPGVNAQRA
jgi:hypothetical protein